MARDAVAVTLLTKSAAVATPAGVAIVPANGSNVAQPPRGWRKSLLRITNTSGGTSTVTVRAGGDPTNRVGPAQESGQGDLVLTLTAGQDVMVVLPASRFEQSDGTINVDYSVGTTGAISAIAIPNTV